MNNSIINSSYNKKDILKKIKLAQLQKKIKYKNDFYKSNTAMNIVNYIKKCNLEDFKYKKFIDLKR